MTICPRTLTGVSLMSIMAAMARGNPNWGRKDAVDWRFRVRGKNPAGEIVILGNYEKEGEATARYDELVGAGYYRNVRVQRLKPKPADPDSDGTGSPL